MRRILGTLLAAAVTVLGAVVGVSAPAQAAGHTPVVFVHGYTGNASNWVTAEAVFAAAGYSSNEMFAFNYNSYGDNKTNAASLASASSSACPCLS